MSNSPPQDAQKGSDLFRNAEQAPIDRLDLGVHVVRPPQWILLAILLLFLAGAVVFGILLPVPIKVHAQGILITAEGLKEIESLTAGRIKDILVQSGDYVRAGQKIAQIDQPDLDLQLEQAQAELTNLRNRRAKVVEFHERTSKDYEASSAQKQLELKSLIESYKKQVDWLEENLAGYAKLSNQGYISQEKLNEIRVRLNANKAEFIKNSNAMQSLEFEANNRRIEREREILDLDVKAEQGRQQVAALREKRLRHSFLESPYDGMVVEQKLNLGEVIEAGKPILSVLPGRTPADRQGNALRLPLVAILFLPATEGKRVQPDMEVQIVPATVKREEFGFILGRMTTVAEVPATPEGMMRSLKNRQLVEKLSAGGAPFYAEAVLEMDEATQSGFRWSSSAGPDQVIGPGSLCSADIVVKKQPLISLVMPAIRRIVGMFIS